MMAWFFFAKATPGGQLSLSWAVGAGWVVRETEVDQVPRRRPGWRGHISRLAGVLSR